jgi:kumamolisin
MTVSDRVELGGSHQEQILGSKEIGPTDLNLQIGVTIFTRRKSSFSNAIAAHMATSRPSSSSPAYLTREEFESLYGTSEADFAAIRSFAAQYGLKVVAEIPASHEVRLTGSVSAFNTAFGVSMVDYQSAKSGTYRGRVGVVTIPSNLKDIIKGVFGFETNAIATTHFRTNFMIHTKAETAAVSYSPLQVAEAYQFPAATGAGQCIAVIELGGGYSEADLNLFFQNLGIKTPTVTAVSVDGGSNAPTGDSNGPDAEVELDIEVAGAIAPDAQIAAYFAVNTTQGFLQAVSAAVHDAKLKPSVISISWGGEEHSWTAQARNLFSDVFQDAATMGVTILAASGDDGADDDTPTNTPAVDFPAASPYVIGCGGTTLTLNGSKITNEIVWNELASNEGASGGGVSEGFHLPTYQNGNSVPKAVDGFVGRGVPDVAANADPNTGYSVVVDGQQTVIGGTSASAPLWAGLIARINQLLGTNVGYVNPLLYAATAKATFRQITSGSNGFYNAKAGWNPCTGLGTPNGTALLAALKTLKG